MKPSREAGIQTLKRKTAFIVLLICAASVLCTGIFLYLGRDRRSVTERVRDEIMEEIKTRHPETKQFIMDLEWSGKRVTSPTMIGGEVYEYRSKGWIVTVDHPVTPNPECSVTADFSVSRLPGYVGIPYRVIWQGTYRNGIISETNYFFAQ